MMYQLSLTGTVTDDEYQDALSALRVEREQVKRAEIVLDECRRREQQAWLRVTELEQPWKGKGN